MRADIEAFQKQVVLPQKLLWKLFDLLEESLLFLAGAIDRITQAVRAIMQYYRENAPQDDAKKGGNGNPEW